MTGDNLGPIASRPQAASLHHTGGQVGNLPHLLHKVAGPGLLLVISILFHWKLVLTNQYTWLESGDIGSLILPWFQFQAGEWHSWRFPLWDPNSWAGQPLFGQAQPGAAYPLNWLLFWMPLDHGWLRQDVLHWFYVLVHYLAGLTCYALCRELGRSRLASVLGGIVYSLAGYVASVDSPQMLHGAVWVPLVFLFLFRAMTAPDGRGSLSAVLAGFFLGITWLVGHHQMQVLLSIAVAIALIAARRVRLAVLVFGIVGLTSAFQTLPAAEYGRQAVRWVGAEEPQGLHETVPYNVHAQYSLKPISLIGIVVAGVEQAPYGAFCGVAAFSLAILGAILSWSERRVRWLAAIGLGGILFALGSNNVFHGMFYALVPLVEKVAGSGGRDRPVCGRTGSAGGIRSGRDFWIGTTRTASLVGAGFVWNGAGFGVSDVLCRPEADG